MEAQQQTIHPDLGTAWAFHDKVRRRLRAYKAKKAKAGITYLTDAQHLANLYREIEEERVSPLPGAVNQRAIRSRQTHPHLVANLKLQKMCKRLQMLSQTRS